MKTAVRIILAPKGMFLTGGVVARSDGYRIVPVDQDVLA
jgi:hypothetical protein